MQWDLDLFTILYINVYDSSRNGPKINTGKYSNSVGVVLLGSQLLRHIQRTESQLRGLHPNVNHGIKFTAIGRPASVASPWQIPIHPSSLLYIVRLHCSEQAKCEIKRKEEELKITKVSVMVCCVLHLYLMLGTYRGWMGVGGDRTV